MRNLLKNLIVSVMICAGVYAQPFTITNTYVMTNVVKVVQTFNFGSMVGVVSSAGAPMTNSSLWNVWIPKYIDACIYTNGLTTNNVTDVRVFWGEPAPQIRGIYQGTPPAWNGSNYITLPLAKERILAGQRLFTLIAIVDNSTTLTNLAQSSNVVYNSSGVLYKVIEIPKSKPAWIP